MTEPGREPHATHRWATTIGITTIGALLFVIALLTRAGVIVSLGIVLLAWLGTFLVARARGSALTVSLVAALPLILLASIVLWVLVLFGGAGG